MHENNQIFMPIMFLVLYCISKEIQRQEHDRHDNLIVLLYERHNVLVIPEIQSPLCNLKNKLEKWLFFLKDMVKNLDNPYQKTLLFPDCLCNSG